MYYNRIKNNNNETRAGKGKDENIAETNKKVNKEQEKDKVFKQIVAKLSKFNKENENKGQGLPKLSAKIFKSVKISNIFCNTHNVVKRYNKINDRNNKELIYRSMSFSSAMGMGNRIIQAGVMKPVHTFKNLPLRNLGEKSRDVLVMNSLTHKEHSEVSPFSSSQGPGEFIKLSNVKHNGKVGTQCVTEKFAVNEKTKKDIQIYVLDDTGLPGVSKATDPTTINKLKGLEATIKNYLLTDNNYFIGLKKSILMKVEIFVENEK